MKWTLAVGLTLSLMLSGCTRRKAQEETTFRFCAAVTSSKPEYLRCFTDLLECYEESPEQFTNDQQTFIECARLLYPDETAVSAPAPKKADSDKPLTTSDLDKMLESLDAEIEADQLGRPSRKR